jgi:hypothetical protein
MRFLEYFLEALSLNPFTKNSSIFYDFLSIEKESEWNHKKKEYGKLKAPIKLGEMKSLDGKVKIPFLMLGNLKNFPKRRRKDRKCKKLYKFK